jgi:cobalt-zinc-cadmium efflux system membrane fusion protein
MESVARRIVASAHAYSNISKDKHMKRFLLGSLIVLGILAITGIGVSALRPDLMPPWARLKPSTAVADSGPQCEEHGVPEKFCTLCHPELKEKLLLCPEHGNIPEDICTLCHKESQQKYNIKMCPKEHGLPEHFCSKCSKEPTASSANLIDDGYCAANGEPIGPEGKPRFCKLLPMVRLASAETGKDIGLRTARATEIEHTHEVIANAETAYDANKYAEIFPRVAGFLREARMDLGQKVEAGAVIAVIDSSELSTTKTQYLTAHATVDLDNEAFQRMKSLSDQNIVGSKPLFEARIAMQQARNSLLNAEQKLRNFRYNDAGLATILKANDTNPSLDITTPIAGTVVFRHAVVGEAEEATTKLYTVVDTEKMWLWVDVYEKDIAQIRAGQPVSFTVSATNSASEDATFKGLINWVGTEVDHTTRTTKVRAELPNPDGKLRANQFGRAAIQIGDRHKAVTVAKSAVQRYENADLVFVPQTGSVYRPQRIVTKPSGKADILEVTWGLKAGQEVVTTAAFLLKTEIMKGSIGAGCCD